MPRDLEERREYMRLLMARKRANKVANKLTVSTVESVSPEPPMPVNQKVLVSNSVSPERQSLRDRLDAYQAAYRLAARQEQWDECGRINKEREPLFWELWKLEKDTPREGWYWFPARVINQNKDFSVPHAT